MSILTTTTKRTPVAQPPTKASGLPTGQVEVLVGAASNDVNYALEAQNTSLVGLSESQVSARVSKYGSNEVGHDKPAPALVQFLRTFTNPFILILLFLSAVMVLTDVVFIAPEDDPDWTGVIPILVMVFVSAVVRFIQEYRASQSAEKLKAMVSTTTAVTRRLRGESQTKELPIEDVVPGDIVELAAGDMIPGDVRFLRVKDLEINQSMLTGEALAATKSTQPAAEVEEATLLDAPNLGFMGTSVVSGSGTAVVVGTGKLTYFGAMASTITEKRAPTAFDLGIKKVTYVLIAFMCVMVPTIFVINGLTKSWTEAFLFAVVCAVGLTPEMMPLIVTANLAKGANFMAKRKVVVKQLNSIQNLGAMDVLCTDKTGTLTEDRIVLQNHLDPKGQRCENALKLGAANAYFQTGLRNLLDKAVIDAAGEDTIAEITAQASMVDEIPFDFARRRMSVVLTQPDGSHQIITKGAVEEVLALCTHECVEGETVALESGRLAQLDRLVAEENTRGMRVLAIATKVFPSPEGKTEYSRDDENDLTLVGLLTFLDPPKSSAKAAIKKLRSRGTNVKVITGDNPLVAATVCRQVGLEPGEVVLGTEIEAMTEEELKQVVRETVLFAKVNPLQKARIVSALRAGGATVGFMGDGINDAPALRAADVGISVDTAVDIAKESADIILLEKDLTVLEGGVMEGRRTYVNTMKYIKMTASSNFGGTFAILVASALLPFIPMIPLVVLVQNLSYDLSMLALPWDRVDASDVDRPRTWDPKGLTRFMLIVGPISSLFDIATWALMWWIFKAQGATLESIALFQSGWFIESIISQTLIVHMIRTRNIPFLQSRPSLPLALTTGAVVLLGLTLPFTALGAYIGLVPVPLMYFPWLILILFSYCALTQFIKTRYLRTSATWI